MPDVSIADMAVGRTGADDGSSPCPRRGCGRTRRSPCRTSSKRSWRRKARDQPERELAGLAGLPVPESYRGVVVRAEETGMFDGMASRDKDPRKSLHLQEVPTPELGPGEALVAVMASAINYNTVWTVDLRAGAPRSRSSSGTAGSPS